MSRTTDAPHRHPHELRCAHTLRMRRLVTAGADPFDPPVWLRHRIAAEIHEHCGHTPLKAHRLAWDLSVERAVRAVHELWAMHLRGSCGLDERLWKRWEHDTRPRSDYEDLLCRLFQTRPDRLGFGTDHTPEDTGAPIESEVDGVGRWRPAARLPVSTARTTGEPPRTPAHEAPVEPGHRHTVTGHADRPSIERLITMAAHDSADYTDRPSNVGPATIDQLRVATTRLARSFANAPRYEVLAQAKWLRDRVFALLDGRQRVSESRDLYFLGGAACGMLAEITEDLGYRAEAMAHTQAAWLCAKEAGHTGLMAWIRAEQSTIAYLDGQPAHAADYARRGQEHATSGTVAAWLAAAESRAAAGLGDRERARGALVQSQESRERVAGSDLDEFGGILAFPTPKQHHYGADSCIGVGDANAAIVEAGQCITGYQNCPDDERAYDNEASAYVNLATAHAMNGDLEAARESAQPALSLAPELRIDALSGRFRRLHRRLSTPEVRDAPVAVELRDQIESFLAAPIPSLPGA